MSSMPPGVEVPIPTLAPNILTSSVVVSSNSILPAEVPKPTRRLSASLIPISGVPSRSIPTDVADVPPSLRVKDSPV